MLEAVRFFWSSTRGHRFIPWRSEYLRWRVETYTGKLANDVRGRDFWDLFWNDRAQFFRFLGWVGEMREYRNGRGQD